MVGNVALPFVLTHVASFGKAGKTAQARDSKFPFVISCGNKNRNLFRHCTTTGFTYYTTVEQTFMLKA
jgi:hypothetical protein